MIVGEGEVRFRFPRFVVGAEAKIFVDLVGVDELVGIQAVGGIEDALELPEGLHQVFAEHLGVERGTGLAVSVLSGERASVGESDVGGLIDEATEFEDAFRGFEVEVDAHVDAALTEVSVHGAGVAVLSHQGADGAEIGAKLRGINGRILPSLPSG
jgi:hypothetical protein